MQQVTVAQVPTYATTEAASADPDFLVQGEYTGNARAMQVVALGDGEFEVSFFNGGLPGAGWDRSPPQKFDADAEQIAELVESNQFTRVERSSPTMGQKPPPGAVVLFDGSPTSLVDHWQPGAQLSDDGLLMQGATSLDTFDNYSLHLEFRTPFMPTARGQARGNSGLYHQGRYETQILDSFGLEGKMNETGGLYSIKDPDLNMCLPPLVWQTYDVDFTAAQYDDEGKQLSQPRITVRVNGVTVQQDVLLPQATTAAPQKIGPTPGPIFLQDHGNPVRFRNIWVVPRDLVQEARRPRLAGFERFYARGETSALGGRLLIHELGCAACHATGESPAKQAPVLDTVGSRIRPDHLLAFIADPHAAKPGTTMPNVLAGRSPAERQQAARALASFLLTTGTSVDRFGDPRAVTRGDDLFHSIGCTACHAPQAEGTIVAEATSHPLAHLGDKYTLDSLSDFLRAPHKVRPSGRMPSMGLNEQQASDIATYLLRSVVIGQGALNTHAAFYEGSWNSLPDLDELKPTLQLETYGLDILASQRSQNFAARFDTFIVLPKDAEYTFQLTSDDGSRLFVDGQEIIDHDGVHAANSKSAKVRLTGGSHALRVEYFEAAGEEVLQLDVRGGGLPLTSIESLATLDPSVQHVAPLIESQFVGNVGVG